MDIYVQKDGQKLGPFPETRILSGITAGEFKPDDLGWTEGSTSPQPLSVLTTLVSQPPKSDPSETSILDHDLTKGHYGPFWLFMVGAGKFVGIGLFVAFGAVLLSDLFSNHHPKSYGYGDFSLNDQFAKHLAEIAPGGKLTGTPSPKRFGQDKQTFDDLDKQLADRKREVANQSSSTGGWAGLRRERKEFVSFYGELLATSANSAPPASATVGFEHDDLAFVVSFWKAAAHEVDVCRKDGKQLSDQDVQWGLAAFTDGKKWRVSARSADGQATE